MKFLTKLFPKYCFLFFIFLSPILGFAQENIEGFWRGYNTQDASDTYSSKYDFELYLKQDGQQIWGRSYAYIEELHAEMEIKGTWNGEYLMIEEVKIVNSKANDGMEWCLKKAILDLVKEGEKWSLQGDWSGHTSFSDCTPGKVFLERITPIP